METITLVKCGYENCTVKFEMIDGRRYCKRSHARKQSAWRRAKGLAITSRMIERPGMLCPTPYKIGYGSHVIATQVANALGGDAAGLRPYRCVCGTLHNGHAPGTKQLW